MLITISSSISYRITHFTYKNHIRAVSRMISDLDFLDCSHLGPVPVYRNTPCNTVFLGVCFNIELKVRRNTRYAGSSTRLVNIFPRKLQDLNLNFLLMMVKIVVILVVMLLTCFDEQKWICFMNHMNESGQESVVYETVL